MRDAQFLDKTRRKHPTRKRPTKDGRELIIQPTNPHILKLEIRRDDRGRRSPITRILQLDRAPRVLEPLDLGAFHDDAHRIPIDTLERRYGTDGGFEDLASVVEYDGLTGREWEV